MEQNQQGGSNQALPTAQNFQNLEELQRKQLKMFWSYQRLEMKHAADFKNNDLPLARIKKIMKAYEDVRMVSAETPILFSKACELFVLELTIRSWLHTKENKRRTLQKNDIAAAITRTDIFDFLVDIVPREDAFKEEACTGLLAPPLTVEAGVESSVAAVDEAVGVPYYYQPMGSDMFLGQLTELGFWGEDGSEAQGPYRSGGDGQGMDGVPGFVATDHPPLPPPPGNK